MSITLSETEQVFFVGQVVFAQEVVFGNKLNKYFLFFFFFRSKKGRSTLCIGGRYHRG